MTEEQWLSGRAVNNSVAQPPGNLLKMLDTDTQITLRTACVSLRGEENTTHITSLLKVSACPPQSGMGWTGYTRSIPERAWRLGTVLLRGWVLMHLIWDAFCFYCLTDLGWGDAL